MTIKASVILGRVLETFQDGRWFQGDWQSKTGRLDRRGNRKPPQVNCFCLAGAIGRAHGAPGNNHNEINRRFQQSPARCFIMEATETGSNGELYNWNDNHNRTIGEVKAAVKRAIKLAKAAEKAAA